MKRILSMLLCIVLILGCTAAHAVEPQDADLVDNWYEIFVASYADGDGDRVGDFKGLTQKLDYIHDMGFRGIWLMPIHPSPTYHKYDVTDYCAIAPEYGTMEDFEAFLARAHELGIKVILDLVVNHSSNEHPWFQSAKSDPASPYREYYRFSSEQKAGYNQLPDGTWFESRFVSTMPDLNLDSPVVLQEIESIMRFWLDKGVDGFRLDAVTSYYTGSKSQNIAFLSWLTNTAKEIRPDAIIIGECWEDLYTIKDYYASGADSFFLFPAAQSGGYIAKILSNDVEKKGVSFGNVVALIERELGDEWVTPFLGNHDMNRIANAVGYYNPTNVKMAAGLLALMRGSIFVYYGDEIGMRYLPLPTKEGGYFRTGSRTPMQWDNSANKGFSTAAADKLYLPVDDTADAPTVAAQQADPDSLWHTVQGVLNFRHSHRDLDSDAPFHVRFAPKAKGSYRPFAWERGKLICAVNPAREEAELPLKLEDGTRVLHVIGKAEVKGDELVLGAQSFAILG